MRIPLQNRAAKYTLVALAALAALAFGALAAVDFVAAHFAGRSDLQSLKRAVQLQPGNADNYYRLGRYYDLIVQSPEAAAQAFRTAIDLNPNSARYWLSVAGMYQLLERSDAVTDAVNHAVSTEPTTPQVAWDAANLYVVQGDGARALHEFSIVMAHDPYLPAAALRASWRLRPDADALLDGVVPAIPKVYARFLELLLGKKETAGAAKLWGKMVALRQPVDRGSLFYYINYLVQQKEVDQARLVWKQGAPLAGLAAYQPSSDNLLVNGDFSLDVINGGFDWMYRRSREVSLSLDPRQHQSGRRSLEITFDTHGIEDAGIRQMVTVDPNTSYDFSAFFRAEDLEGVGGPRFLIQDMYSQAVMFASDDLTNVDSWKQVHGRFVTGADTKLLVVRIQRNPPGSPIKGKLWIDDLRLVGGDVKG